MQVTQQTRHRNHSPRQETILMVERCIREEGVFRSKYALMQALPRKMEHSTLISILTYLEASNKIFLGEDGSVTWVFTDNPKLLKLLAESPVMR